MVSSDKKAIILPQQLMKYLTAKGTCPFDRWRKKQKGNRGVAVDQTLERVRSGQSVKVKSYGGGIGALIISWPTKIRIYYALLDDGTLLLLGGEESGQATDIKQAKEYLKDYEKRGTSDA